MSAASEQIELRDRIVEFRRVNRGEILANPRNFRRHPDTQREVLRKMLATVGIAGAALAYRSERAGGALVYIDGHLRDEEIPANLPVLITDLNDSEADALLAGYDHLSALADQDDAALVSLLQSLSAESLPATGYDDAAIRTLVESVAAEERRANPVEDAGPQIDEAEALQAKWSTAVGQIWQAGKHRLMVGDSTNYDDVATLMDFKHASLLVTDPPYNVGKDYGDDVDDAKLAEAYETFSREWFASWQAVSGRQIVTPGFNNLSNWCRWFDPYHVTPWTKTNAMTNGKVSRWCCWEPVMFFGSGWRRERSNDVFDFPIGQQSDVAGHPCPKPLKMWADLIENYSDEGDLIADAFCGSGTAVIAAEQSNRSAVVMDKEAKWIAVTLQRWSDLTGLTPRLA